MEISDKDLLEMYRHMLRLRRFDEKWIELANEGRAVESGWANGIGEEATGVGTCYKLRPDDYILPSLRTRGAFLMRVPFKELMATIFGKATGCSKGKTDHHHLGYNERGIIGTTGIVGGHICAAAGVALACKMKKKSSVVLCFMGDRGSRREEVHAAFNFAAVQKLPIIFIVENNLYGEATPTSPSIPKPTDRPTEDIAVLAGGYGFPGIVVDGMDVMAVHETVQKAVERARREEGPSLIECKTFQFVYLPEYLVRPEEEVEAWRKKDPISTLKSKLLKNGLLTEELNGKLEKQIKEEIDEAIKFAEDSPFPKPEETLTDVYAEVAPELLVERKLEGPIRDITMGQALNEALREEMRRDENVFIIGEELGPNTVYPKGREGGVFPTTKGICTEFPERAIGTPIAEMVIVGAAAGAAIMGMRPVAEIMFCDWSTICADQIINYAAKQRYNYGGRISVPLVVRTTFGVGSHLGPWHSQSLEALFLNVPGLKVVMPSTPYDGKGLLKASIRDGNPVIFYEHRLLYGSKGKVPEEEYTVPLGKADVKREGNDVTIVATGIMVHKALSAADKLHRAKGISCEIVDPRTLLPLDKDTIVASVKKTGKLVIVHEAPKTFGFGAEVAAAVAEEALTYLDAPIIRVGAPFTPVPFSPSLEKFYMRDEQDIASAVLKITH